VVAVCAEILYENLDAHFSVQNCQISMWLTCYLAPTALANPNSRC
jgi:hypothetical protein